MGASNIDQKLSGVLLVEHLAALGVVLMAVGWLALLMRTYQQVVIPVRQETTAYVALMRGPARGGETQVSVGPDVWKVVVSAKEVRVDANNSTASYTFNP